MTSTISSTLGTAFGTLSASRILTAAATLVICLIIIRLLMPGDKPRNISFTLHGHRWRTQPDDPFSRIVPIQGAMSVGNVFNIEPEPVSCPGDYLYRSGSLRWDVESGMWGIFRIVSRNVRYYCETACRNFRQWWEKKWYEK